MPNPNVLIVGGGPAGAAVAIALARRGLRPVVLEAGTGPTLKVGESLPPGAGPLIDALGLTAGMHRAGQLRAHGNRFLWGSKTPAERDFIFGVHGAGWRLDRLAFEAALSAEAIEAGADWRFGRRVVASSRDPGGSWRLEVESPDGMQTCEADVVVDATGRAARCARMLGARRIRYDRLIGVAVHFERCASGNDDSFTLVEAVAGGWWYSALLPGDKLVAVYMTDGDLIDAGATRTIAGWRALSCAAAHTARRLSDAGGAATTAPRVVPADTSRLTSVAGEGWIAVGDAAVAYDPLASHGITMALGGGLHAADAIADYLEGRADALRRYASLIDRAFARYLFMLEEQYSEERRWLEEPFWQRRVRSR